ncbi:hypothetical protein [Paraclostridium dentum]|uniref:hypothetical protein n=1 Tax=Paraclostridium dentum TaxID=2662455 RepID=UPI003F3575D0
MTNGYTDDVVKELNDIAANKKKLDAMFDTVQGKLDFNAIADAIKHDSDLYDILGKEAKDILSVKWAQGIPSNFDDALKDLSIVLRDADVIEALSKGSLKINGLDELFNVFKGVIKNPKISMSSLKGLSFIDDLFKIIAGALKLN